MRGSWTGIYLMHSSFCCMFVAVRGTLTQSVLFVRFGVLTAVLMWIQILWDVMLWQALSPHIPPYSELCSSGPWRQRHYDSWKCWEQSKISHIVMDDIAFSLFAVVGMCSLYTGHCKGQHAFSLFAVVGTCSLYTRRWEDQRAFSLFAFVGTCSLYTGHWKDQRAFSLFAVVGTCSLYTGHWKSHKLKLPPTPFGICRIHCKFWCLLLSTLVLGKTRHV